VDGAAGWGEGVKEGKNVAVENQNEIPDDYVI